jgi:hypothetical protein
MIKNFACKETESIREGRSSKKLPDDIQSKGSQKIENDS